MGLDQLSLYNNALVRHLGNAKLAGLTDNSNTRYTLDTIWDSGNFINDILKQGSWTFATRSLQMESDPDIDPSFGYPYAFEKPADWLRTVMVCSDQFYTSPILQYNDEAGVWYANMSTIYVKFVSNDPAYGGDLSLWPESVVRFAEAYMAWNASFTLAQDKTLTDILEKRQKRLLLVARGRDAMDKPTGMFAQGSWTTARMGGWGRRYGNGGGGSDGSF